MKRFTLSEFLQRAKVERPEYDYSCITKYRNNTTPIIVICPKHGRFLTTPQKLLNRSVRCLCPQCARECSINRLGATYNTTQDFVNECIRLWPNRCYDFSTSEYSGSHNKIEVLCLKHGAFTCTAHRLISTEHVCKECIKEIHIENKYVLKKSRIVEFIGKNSDWFNSIGIEYSL